MLTSLVTCLLGAYFVGAIPFGLLIARAHRIDLRQVGSGNIGATNVTRSLGRRWGITCFFLDALKGCLPVVLALVWLKPAVLEAGHSGPLFTWLWLAVGLLAILGHVFPVYLGFRGGKGVATSFGVAMGLWPFFTGSAILALAIWGIVLYRWKYVSLASMVASAAFPLILIVSIVIAANWTFMELWPLVLISLIIPMMVLVTHRANITRLCAGTESKIGKSGVHTSE